MNLTKFSVLITIMHVIKKFDNFYCEASQKKIIQLLKQYHNITINRRQLNYHLHDLREAGLLRSIKRCVRREDGTLSLKTTATCLTMKACVLLGRKGITWATRHLKRLKTKYFPGGNARPVPSKPQILQENKQKIPSKDRSSPLFPSKVLTKSEIFELTEA
ncbi:hypothetical protein ES703_43354 [subsurface metagenome]